MFGRLRPAIAWICCWDQHRAGLRVLWPPVPPPACYGALVTRPVLADAFAHHAWATLRLIDTCLALTPEQLDTAVPGTYGSIVATMRHIVDADAWDLFIFTGDRSDLVDTDPMDLAQLRTTMERHDERWAEVLTGGLDPDVILEEVDEHDGYRRLAPVGIRFAGVLNHGTDHRSQICTALTALGVEPPSIDTVDYGLAVGSVTEAYPTT
jgi:uncharacterized damage-inducible protein DinB